MENVEIHINGEQFKEFFALVKEPKIIVHTRDPKSWIEVRNDLSGDKERKPTLAYAITNILERNLEAVDDLGYIGIDPDSIERAVNQIVELLKDKLC